MSGLGRLEFADRNPFSLLGIVHGHYVQDLDSINSDAKLSLSGLCVRRTKHAKLRGGEGYDRSAKKAAAIDFRHRKFLFNFF